MKVSRKMNRFNVFRDLFFFIGSLVSVKEKLSHVETEKKKLIHDNSSLYEKIRYLQNYSQSSKSSQRYKGHIESIESGL